MKGWSAIPSDAAQLREYSQRGWIEVLLDDEFFPRFSKRPDVFWYEGNGALKQIGSTFLQWWY